MVFTSVIVLKSILKSISANVAEKHPISERYLVLTVVVPQKS